MKYVLLAVCLVGLVSEGCAIRYKAGATCWSAEMVSTEDWCEKQRVIEKASRDYYTLDEIGKVPMITTEELWADQLRKDEVQP